MQAVHGFPHLTARICQTACGVSAHHMYDAAETQVQPRTILYKAKKLRKEQPRIGGRPLLVATLWVERK
jgi:hypothetical protein